jgi:hypothetical protein
MPDAQARRTATRPRWDGRRILFELQHDGAEVSCSISPDALRDLSSRRCYKPTDLLQCFAAERPRIEAAARGKLGARAACATDLLTIWSDDVEGLTKAGLGGSAR